MKNLCHRLNEAKDSAEHCNSCIQTYTIVHKYREHVKLNHQNWTEFWWMCQEPRIREVVQSYYSKRQNLLSGPRASLTHLVHDIMVGINNSMPPCDTSLLGSFEVGVFVTQRNHV